MQINSERVKKDISDIKTDIALLINKVDTNHKSLRDSVDRTCLLIEKHDKIFHGNGNRGLITKVDGIESAHSTIQADFRDHVTLDRWLFGLVFSTQLAILLKLFFR